MRGLAPLLCAAALTSGLVRPAPAASPERLTCYSTVFEPFVREVDGELAGDDVERVLEVGRRLGIDIEVALMPWPRLQTALAEGDPDVRCAFAFFRTSEREEFLDFTSVPLHVTRYVLFVRSADAGKMASPHAIFGRTIAVNRGFRIPEPLRVAVEAGSILLHEVGEESQSLQMLALGRVDAVLTDLRVGRTVLSDRGLEGIEALPTPVEVRPAYLVLSKAAGLGDLVPRIDATLREVVGESGSDESSPPD